MLSHAVVVLALVAAVSQAAPDLDQGHGATDGGVVIGADLPGVGTDRSPSIPDADAVLGDLYALLGEYNLTVLVEEIFRLRFKVDKPQDMLRRMLAGSEADRQTLNNAMSKLARDIEEIRYNPPDLTAMNTVEFDRSTAPMLSLFEGAQHEPDAIALMFFLLLSEDDKKALMSDDGHSDCLSSSIRDLVLSNRLMLAFSILGVLVPFFTQLIDQFQNHLLSYHPSSSLPPSF